MPRANALLRAGLLARAEALYYAAARRRPRDPEARFALGRYLASRGALRVGAVLIEEGRRFGGDSATAAALLAPLYAQLDDYAALTRLAHARLSSGELARARALHAAPPTVAGPDSVRLPLLPGGSNSLGALRLVVGSDTLRVEIDPEVTGVVLDRAHVRTPGVRVFGDGGAAALGIVTRGALGPIHLRNMPVSFEELGGRGQARVGLDWLARWAPTIDPAHSRTVVLRRSGRLSPNAGLGRAGRIPLLADLPDGGGERRAGPWIVVPGGVARLGGAELARLRTTRLTLDPRRGELLLDP